MDELTRQSPEHLALLEGKVAVVTGCTLGGIGAHTALVLAGQAKMEVVLAGRTMSKLEACASSIREKFPGAKLTYLQLDCASFQSVRAFAAAFKAKYGAAAPLALLVNNAGIMAGPYATSADGVELQMATNHLGPFLLSCLLAPNLRAGANACPTAGARLVNVASMAHALPFPYGSQPLPLNRKYGNKNGPKFFAYGRSKRANVLSAVAFSKRLQAKRVTCLSLCPGNVKTNLGQSNGAAWVVYEVFSFVHKTVTQGASTTLYACLKPEFVDSAAYGGAYLIHDKPRTTAGVSEDCAEVMWRESAEAVGLTKEEEAAVVG